MGTLPVLSPMESGIVNLPLSYFIKQPNGHLTDQLLVYIRQSRHEMTFPISSLVEIVNLNEPMAGRPLPGKSDPVKFN